jgi:hypothetical protein
MDSHRALRDGSHAGAFKNVVSFGRRLGNLLGRGIFGMQGKYGTASFQTVRLARGRHRSANDGACAMELASMIAGERFSDHPQTVSPVVAAFVRVYNDLIDDRRRRDLLDYAAAAIGTKGSIRREKARARRIHDWLKSELGDRGGLELWALGVCPRWRRKRQVVAERAARYAASSRSRHDAALRLLDELLGIPSPIAMKRELENLGGVQHAPSGEPADLTCLSATRSAAARTAC